ncbi:MAG: hypothetical protein UY48_C0004G0003 [Candidatus Gottesmanbacteria bacterium GW2011_GWB1_49_7]|uniref:Uncharacterized protein n=1 Tax=Candidatus Gottesmanbacteria bacterium GW2011_GWB1_49_7 TaxID=1618448 RepID=A0A0G1W362_9BACT|nr:MAG: hypothetical protein UY48_C0004G0003 [Candidatus Gottesmanbacteria bacterium GW2011_GWB1_49_7]
MNQGFGIDIFVEPGKYKITPRKLAQMPEITKEEIKEMHNAILMGMAGAIKRTTQNLMRSGGVTPPISGATAWSRMSRGYGTASAFESGALADALEVKRTGDEIMVGIPMQFGQYSGQRGGKLISLSNLAFLLHSRRNVYVSPKMAGWFKYAASAGILPPSFLHIRPGKVLRIPAFPFLEQGVKAFLSDKATVDSFSKMLNYGIINRLKQSIRGIKPRTIRYGRGEAHSLMQDLLKGGL